VIPETQKPDVSGSDFMSPTGDGNSGGNDDSGGNIGIDR
jgi:hypothetical protein